MKEHAQFSKGDLIVSRLKPFCVQVIQRVYGAQCDVRQPAGGLITGVPVRVLEKVPADVQLYGMGEEAFGIVWAKAVVVGADGIVRWLAEQSQYTVDRAYVCEVKQDNGAVFEWGEWHRVAGLLASQDGQAEALEATA